MKDYQNRVIKERNELVERYDALQIFIEHNPIFKDLPIIDKGHLRQQLVAMQTYCTILNNRIERF